MSIAKDTAVVGIVDTDQWAGPMAAPRVVRSASGLTQWRHRDSKCGPITWAVGPGGGGPGSVGSALLQHHPVAAGDQMAKTHNGVGEAIKGPPKRQEVVIAHYESGSGHHLEMVDYVAWSPAHCGGDPPLEMGPWAICIRIYAVFYYPIGLPDDRGP